MPLIARGEAIGVINFHTKYAHKFTEEEVEFLGAIGGQAATAIQNAQFHDQIAQQALALERSNQTRTRFQQGRDRFCHFSCKPGRRLYFQFPALRRGL